MIPQHPLHLAQDRVRAVAELERLIGQLTVENAFLKKVLARLDAKQVGGR